MNSHISICISCILILQPVEKSFFLLMPEGQSINSNIVFAYLISLRVCFDERMEGIERLLISFSLV